MEARPGSVADLFEAVVAFMIAPVDEDRAVVYLTSALLEAGALYSVSTRAPLKLAFPAKYAGRWMPGLFPDRED